MTAIRRLEPVQWSAILGAIGVLLWSIPGLFVNPDFSTGHAATSKLVLGVDMNGWHAVSGFPLALGAFWFARRARDAAVYVPLAAGALIATGIWALLSTRPAAGLFYFPHNHGDAWLHFSVAAIFLAGLVHYLLTRQSGASIEYTTRWSRLPTTSAQSSSRSASVIGRRSRSASSSKRKPR